MSLDILREPDSFKVGFIFLLFFQTSSDGKEKLFKYTEETSIKEIKTESFQRRLNSNHSKSVLLGGLSKHEAKLKSIFDRKPFSSLNLTGFLISGPPGSGKTSLVKKSLNGNCLLLRVQCSTLMRPHPGETEKILKDLFQKAKLHSSEGTVIQN